MCLKTTKVRTINKRKRPETTDEFIRRYPAVTAHLVAERLGYFTPESAAMAGLDGLHGRENWCEYIGDFEDRSKVAFHVWSQQPSYRDAEEQLSWL
jgi:hypothetical protein